MTSKVLLVGQALGARKGEPFDGASGKRLAALAGLDHADFLNRFEHVSLLEQPAKAEFDVRAARDRADALREGWRGRRVVLLGRGVAAALRLVPDDYEWFQVLELPPGFEAAVMPHPSGISHWWNDDANIRRARDFMLRVKLGFLAPQRPRGKERFTEDEMAAALEAGRGVYAWAAQALAEETGRTCCHQTVANYVARYPRLAEVGHAQVSNLVDRAKKNIIRDIEAGGVDSSWKLMRSTIGQGSGFELVVHAKVSGRVDHDHRLSPAMAALRGRLSDAEVDVLEGVYEKLAEVEDAAGPAEGAEPRLPASGAGAAR